MSFFLFGLKYDLFLLFDFLLYSLFLIHLNFEHLLLRVNNIVLWIFESLFELGELMIESFSFGFVLLDFFGLKSLGDFIDFLLDLVDFEMNFLFHHFCKSIKIVINLMTQCWIVNFVGIDCNLIAN